MSFLSSHQKKLVNRIGTVLEDVEARMMFGTVGLFSEDQQFGILENENLYLCVDDDSRPSYTEAGTTPYNSGAVETAAYLEVPGEVLDDNDAFAAWVQRAVDAAD